MGAPTCHTSDLITEATTIQLRLTLRKHMFWTFNFQVQIGMPRRYRPYNQLYSPLLLAHICRCGTSLYRGTGWSTGSVHSSTNTHILRGDCQTYNNMYGHYSHEPSSLAMGPVMSTRGKLNICKCPYTDTLTVVFSSVVRVWCSIASS